MLRAPYGSRRNSRLFSLEQTNKQTVFGLHVKLNLMVCFIMLHKMLLFYENYQYQYQYEPRREKTGFLHMRKQRRRSASR